ncbi:FAD-dependent oxidoreductase, partial [Candidatus Sumerlaeota bacterium]|nr:FAD-dependent oxidoreductase [Candidatus Sumerlaeota bacterium]
MADLRTKFAGLDLVSPIIVASSGITETVELMRRAQDHGAGAVVMKSYFQHEICRTNPAPCFHVIRHDLERDKTFTFYAFEQASRWDIDRYCEEIVRAKSELSMPIIASINCTTDEGWVEAARKTEVARADALELNTSCPHGSITFRGQDVENKIFHTLEIVREAVKMPLIVKISGMLTAPGFIAHQAEQMGFQGVTMFNRFTGLDFDLETEQPIMHGSFGGHGGPWAMLYPLSWISRLAPQLKIDISATSGVANGYDVVKYLLAGAKTVQVCSAIMLRGFDLIGQMHHELAEFMGSKGYERIEDFRGKLCDRILSIEKVYRVHDKVAKIDPRRAEAPCHHACPIENNPQGYVTLIAKGEFEKAYRLVRERNPLPAICGRVCHHPCEAACTRTSFDQTVAIRHLKRFLGDWARGRDIRPVASKRSRAKVAVVGSGPAGLACAHDLAALDYDVTVFEAAQRMGGMLSWAIPTFRLARDVIEDDFAYIREMGVEIRTGCRIGRDRSLDDLRREGFRAFYLAVGAQESRAMGVPGENMAGVLHGLDFLRALDEGKIASLGQIGPTVAVIGGGHTALDVARAAVRLGAKQVYAVYRRSRAEMPVNDEDIEVAENEGIKVINMAQPTAIIGKGPFAAKSAGAGGGESGRDQVGAIECIHNVLGAPDQSQRRKPEPVGGTTFRLATDTVIIAIGQEVNLAGLDGAGGLVNKQGLVAADELTGQTAIEGVFAGGDAVLGPGTVIEAIAAGKNAARSIDAYLSGRPIARAEYEKAGKVVTLQRILASREIVAQARTSIPHDAVGQAIRHFGESERGYSEGQAMAEAARCLACGCGEGCGLCEKVCLHAAVSKEMGFETIDPEKCE